MSFYGPLALTAWTVTKQWAAAYSLFAWTLIGVVPPLTSIVVFEFLWRRRRRVSTVIWRTLRIVLEGLGTFLVVVAGMFLMSLFYYAPPLVLQRVAADSASAAAKRAERKDKNRIDELSAEVAQLRIQNRSNALAQRLAQAERERDAALEEASQASDFSNRIAAAGNKLGNAEEDFQKAYDRQQEEWSAFTGLFSDMMPLKSGVTRGEALEESHEYEQMKTNTRAAMRNLHDQAEDFHILIQEGY